MVRKLLSPELEQTLSEMAKTAGDDGLFYVIMPAICDKCEDEEKEAFPYGIVDDDGNEHQHLCNECFVILCPEFATCEVCELYVNDCIYGTFEELEQIMDKALDKGIAADIEDLVQETDELLEVIKAAEDRDASARRAGEVWRGK